MSNRKPPPGWQPGQSGNPAGRKPGTSEVAKLRAAIEAHVPEIVTKLVEMAKAGDSAAARLLLERVIPPVKATEQTVRLSLPDGSLTDQGKAVIAALGAGDVAPGQAAQLMGGLAALAKLIETDDLAARVAALEKLNGQ